MRLTALFTLAFAFACLAAPPARAGRTDAYWKASLLGRATDDSLSTSRTVGVAGTVNLRHYFSDSLQARFLGGVLLETGSSSALFTDEFSPTSRIFLREASLRWRVVPGISVLAGALDQGHHQSPLLVAGGTFPALLLAGDYQPGKWIFHVDGQAALPTYRTFSTRSVGKDSTPYLITQKLVFGYDEKNGGFRSLLRATHFQFSGLTHGMAQDSRFYGNTILGPGPAARFYYEYEGVEAGPEISVPLSNAFTWALGASYIQNFRGPRNSDEGGYAFTSLTYRDPSFSLRPGFEWYLAQADSSPGFFTSADFGHNNRRGLGASLRLELKNAGLNFELKGRRSRLINPQAFQQDKFDYVELGVEVPYARF